MLIDKHLETEAKSIVFIGDFNPTILQPFWLAKKSLIRDDEAENAKIEIIHNEIVKYNLGWVEIEITKQKCVISTKSSPHFEPLKDLAIGIFRVLKETPLTALGINHTFDINLFNKESYYAFGNVLSPLSLWNDSLNDPRLLQLEVFEKERYDGLKGLYRVKVAPSDKNLSNVVSVKINDHYDIPDEKNEPALYMVKLLEQNWVQSNNRATNVIVKLLEKTKMI